MGTIFIVDTRNWPTFVFFVGINFSYESITYCRNFISASSCIQMKSWYFTLHFIAIPKFICIHGLNYNRDFQNVMMKQLIFILTKYATLYTSVSLLKTFCLELFMFVVSLTIQVLLHLYERCKQAIWIFSLRLFWTKGSCEFIIHSCYNGIKFVPSIKGLPSFDGRDSFNTLKSCVYCYRTCSWRQQKLWYWCWIF